jgi:hypothetical protein
VNWVSMVLLTGLFAVVGICPFPSLATATTTRTPHVATSSLSAYDLVASDGGIFNFGGAIFEGSTGGKSLNKPIVGMASTPAGGGYWEVASDGGIFAFGDALFYGSTGSIALNRPIVGMAATPDGKGYWLVASDGGIFAFGDAGYFGSQGATPLNKPIVGMAGTPDGLGYWLVASDGGLFTHGDAGYFGSLGAKRLNEPIVGMAATGNGDGYWLVASDGGIFNFGDAAFSGSMGGTALNKPIVGMAATSGTVGTPGVNLFAHIDPSFTQNPNNPLDVTYTYSASATETADGQTSTDASLPSGILDLYSDGSLACSINVGGSITGGACEVLYLESGNQSVTVEYFSGSSNVTDTQVETITDNPATATGVTISGDPNQGSPTSTLSAIVTDGYGSVLPAVGSVAFFLPYAKLTTKSAGQTTCTLDWPGVPTWSSADLEFVDNATSSDCTLTIDQGDTNFATSVGESAGTFNVGATYSGSPLLTQSSGSSSQTDWPATPPPDYVAQSGTTFQPTLEGSLMEEGPYNGCNLYIGGGYQSEIAGVPGGDMVSPIPESPLSGLPSPTTSYTDGNGQPWTPIGSAPGCLIPDGDPIPTFPLTITVSFAMPTGWGVVDSGHVSWVGDQESIPYFPITSETVTATTVIDSDS